MNTFGSAALQVPLYDPRDVRANRQRYRRDSIPGLARANSFHCPVGRYASRGWVLVKRSDYVKLDRYSTSLQLTLGPSLTLKNLSVVQAQCVTRGLASDVNALYLVELTDFRGVLFNRWFRAPTTSNYNVRAPAYPQTFYTPTLNGGSPWTWSTMVGDLWSQAGLGTFPGLPSAPTGTPEGFWLFGTPVWKALNDLLEHLGMTVACDLTNASPFSVVDDGAADAALSTLEVKYANLLEDDLEWLDVGAARIPKTVTVFFRRRNSDYGTEETVRSDYLQWGVTPYYSVAVNAPTAFAGAVGSHFLWSDFTVRYDQDNNPLAADVATAAAVAAERVTQYYGSIYGTPEAYTTRVYTGALPFYAGSQSDGVAWTQDYSQQNRQGWKTTVVHGPYPPWPELWDK